MPEQPRAGLRWEEGDFYLKMVSEGIPVLWATSNGGKSHGCEEEHGESAKTKLILSWMLSQTTAYQEPSDGRQEINVGLQVHLC